MRIFAQNEIRRKINGGKMPFSNSSPKAKTPTSNASESAYWKLVPPFKLQTSAIYRRE